MNIPLTIIISLLPSIIAFITVYTKLKSDIVKLETELKHYKDLLTSSNCELKSLNQKVNEINQKYFDFMIEMIKNTK